MEKTSNSQIIAAIMYLHLNETSESGQDKDIKLIAKNLEKLVKYADNKLIITRETLPKIKLSPTAFKAICNGIKSNKFALKTIRITGQKFAYSECNLIGMAVWRHGKTTILDISDNEITDIGLLSILNSLKMERICSTAVYLEKLNIDNNLFLQQGVNVAVEFKNKYFNDDLVVILVDSKFIPYNSPAKLDLSML